MTSRSTAFAGLTLSLVLGACSKSVPPEVQAVLDAQRPVAEKASDEAVKVCPSWKDRSGVTGKIPIEVPEPKTDHPAKGTTLESEAKVKDVFVLCSWPDPKSAGAFSGTSIPALKRSNIRMVRNVTMPSDLAMTTCKNDVKDCERVVVPSRYSDQEGSADLVIERALPDGGTATVTVVIIP